MPNAMDSVGVHRTLSLHHHHHRISGCHTHNQGAFGLNRGVEGTRGTVQSGEVLALTASSMISAATVRAGSLPDTTDMVGAFSSSFS